MSRKLSLIAKHENRKPRVHFPPALVFLDSIRENDLTQCDRMLRRASKTVDINALNDSGLTPLHLAVLDNNIHAVGLLVKYGANVNEPDTDTWTPLHAACAEGHSDIIRLLLHNGAIKEMKTSEGERPLDLIDAADLQTIGAMLESESVRDVRMEHDDGDSRPVCEYDDGGDSTSTYVNP